MIKYLLTVQHPLINRWIKLATQNIHDNKKLITDIIHKNHQLQ